MNDVVIITWSFPIWVMGGGSLASKDMDLLVLSAAKLQLSTEKTFLLWGTNTPPPPRLNAIQWEDLRREPIMKDVKTTDLISFSSNNKYLYLDYRYGKEEIVEGSFYVERNIWWWKKSQNFLASDFHMICSKILLVLLSSV